MSMSMAAAFTTAWKDIKKAGYEFLSFVNKNKSTIESDVKTVSSVLSSVAPSLTPAATVLDSVEESIVGELAALSTANLSNLAAFAPGVASVVSTIKSQLSGHPAVVAAAANPSAGTYTSGNTAIVVTSTGTGTATVSAPV